MHRDGRAFSLLEVVAAIGVFALGIVVVIGLLGPLAGSVRRNDDAEAVAHIAGALRAELAQRVRHAGSFAPVLELFTPESSANATSALAPLIFANRSGTLFASPNDPRWVQAEPFFAITLAPSGPLAGQEDDATAAILVYTARIRWPARGDAATQQSWHVSGSVRR